MLLKHAGFAVLAVLVLAGCNSMAKKSYQKLAIHTPGLANVDCTLETEGAKYHVLAPGAIEVDRSKQPLTVTCQKAHYLTSVKTLNSRIHMAHSQLNVFNGLIPGIAYDIWGNSVYNYPETIVMQMKLDPDRVILPPLKQYELQRKAEIVTPADVIKAKAPESVPAKDQADKTFSQGLKK